jgi:glycosyltransferase involved in cell wall biosynthesis
MSAPPPIRSQLIHIVDSVANEASGVSYCVPRLCRALAEEGNSVTLMSISDHYRAVQSDYKLETCRQGYAGVPFLRRLRFSRAMRLKLNERAQDNALFHVHGLWLMPNVYPGIVARRHRVPLVLAPQGMLGPEALAFSRRRKQFMWYALQRSAVRAASCLHATSEQEYQEIRAFGLRIPIAVVPNGVDVPSLQYTSPVRRSERTILYLGRIHPKKGLDCLIAAWHRLERQWPDWGLRIIGPDEGGYLDRLKHQAMVLGLRRVSFEAPLFGDQKDEAYRAADIFVLPTLNENFAMTVAEALSQGTPVICTKGAPWQGLETKRCGWWINHGIDALVDSLFDAMSTTRDELAAMGSRGRAWMIRDFSWRSIALEMSEVYRWVSGQGPVPHCVRLV